MHYYQFHIGDYKGHTSYLTPLEDIAFRRLLDEYYLHEKPLKNDLGFLSKIIGMRENEKEISFILENFFNLTDCGWVNERAKREIKAYKSKAKTARENGRKGGRPKKAKKTQSVNLANPEKTESKTNHKPITINQEPLSYTAAMPCKDGEFMPLDSQMKSWNESYPDIDIDKEINKAKSWLLSNPNKQKTVRGCPRFINAWLSRAKPEVLNATHEQDFIQLHTDSSWADGLN